MPFARHVATVGAATLASRLLGFVRDIVIAALFGAGAVADAFFVAFQLPNLARRLLAEGALNAAFVPLYLRAQDAGGRSAAAAFAGRVATALTFLLALAVGLVALLMPWLIVLLAPGFAGADPRLPLAVVLAQLMLPYLVLAGPVAVLIGVLNANQRFATAAFAAFVFNLVLVAVLVGLVLIRSDVVAAGHVAAAAIGFAGLAQLALVAFGVRRAAAMPWPLAFAAGAELRRFLALAVPGIIAAAIPQLTLVAGTMVASAEPNAVSWLYYAYRLFELPLGIVGIAVGTVLVPVLATAARSGDPAALAGAQSRGLEWALGLALPAAVALFVLPETIVRILFERGAFTAADTETTAAVLGALALGLPGHVLAKAFAPAFYAREDTATPLRAALAGLALAIVGSLVLFPLLGPYGIALAAAAGGWIHAAWLAWLIARRIGFDIDAAARRRVPLIAAAAALMGAILVLLQDAATAIAGPPHGVAGAVILALLVAAGLAVYGGTLAIARVIAWSDMTALLRRSV